VLAAADLPHPLKFTRLELDWPPIQAELLSTMTNLQHLSLKVVPPGNVPSQLLKLTYLHLGYFYSYEAAGPIEPLSTFTALRELDVNGDNLSDTCDLARDLSGIACLTQLTRLAIRSSTLAFTTASTGSWARLTALESLDLQLELCDVQSAALAAFTQLRALRLTSADPPEDDDQDDPSRVMNSQELVAAISNMLQLTELHADFYGRVSGPTCTSLVASTQLSVLQLSLLGCRGTRKCVLFVPGSMYPHLRLINLNHHHHFRDQDDEEVSGLLTLGGQQVRLLSSCCPALESLSFRICSQASPADCLPLRQLTTLTHLRVRKLSTATAAAIGAVVSAAAQLTGLQQLSLQHLPQLADPRLLQLSALTALTDLTLSAKHQDDQDLLQEWHIRTRGYKVGR
jgi:hypothetical protein